MLDTNTLNGLKQRRVKVSHQNGPEYATYFGVLRGVTSEKIWVDETQFLLENVIDVEAAPLYCESCGDSTLVLHDGVCASCYREEARSRQAHQEPCAVCGAPGVRNIARRDADEFLCAVHHAESGHGLVVHPFRGPVAPCATQDESSPLHEWQQVRGARFRCVRCKSAEKWDNDLLARLMKERLK